MCPAEEEAVASECRPNGCTLDLVPLVLEFQDMMSRSCSEKNSCVMAWKKHSDSRNHIGSHHHSCSCCHKNELVDKSRLDDSCMGMHITARTSGVLSALQD